MVCFHKNLTVKVMEESYSVNISGVILSVYIPANPCRNRFSAFSTSFSVCAYQGISYALAICISSGVT